MEGNYKEAERDRDDLKKATQAKFGKLSSNHKAGEKLVRFMDFTVSPCSCALAIRIKRLKKLSVNSLP